MSDGRSSSDLRSLIAAAKGDGPGAAVRAKVWGGVSQTLGMAASGGTAGLAGMGAAKMLVVGTLLGGSLSAGIAATAIYLRSASAREAAVDRVSAVHESFEACTPSLVPGSLAGPPTPAAPDPRANLATSLDTSAGGADAVRVVYSPGLAAPAYHPRVGGLRSVPGHAGRASSASGAIGSGGDDLAREAALLSGARSSLASGDAAGALRALGSASKIRARQLVPEGLALEAQALRALGRDHEAAAIEARIKALYPESALAR